MNSFKSDVPSKKKFLFHHEMIQTAQHGALWIAVEKNQNFIKIFFYFLSIHIFDVTDSKDCTWLREELVELLQNDILFITD